MTTNTDIVNRALMIPGTRTLVTDAELAAGSTNEALQANLVLTNIRRRLLRMAPWACSLKTANLVYISSIPGTPENTSSPTTLWQPGTPSPPWAYEYQYPVDCVRACWIIPATQTGFTGGVPITTAVTGGAPSFWQGSPVRFAVQTDTFYSATGVSVVTGGTGYAVGDVVTLSSPPNTSPPNGAPAQLTITAIGVGGTATAVALVNSVAGTEAGSPMAGNYFLQPTNPVSQGSTTGAGTGLTVNLTFGCAAPQRVILTNQEFAILTYCQDVTDPNIMDDLFQDAFVKILGATLAIPLTGDKKLANLAIAEANQTIALARQADGNEGLIINDVTPDWIRIRGIDFVTPYSGPYSGSNFDWGGAWAGFA